MGQILLAGEEPQERPALPGDVVADRPAKHWITGLESVEDRALGRRTFNPEFHLSVDACQSPQMFWEDHSDHGHASRSKSRTSKSRMRSKERAGNNFLIFKLAVRRGSPDPAVCWTVGLPPGLGLETFGRPSGKVRRPCHNLVPQRHNLVPQLGLDCENSGKLFPARSLAWVLVPAFPKMEASHIHPCVVGSLDSLPGLERLARRFDEVEGLLPAERAGQVVIRLVACLLEADEGVRHTLQIGWGRVAFTRRLHCLWKLVVRDHRGGLLHLPVVVRPVDPRSKPWLSGVQGRCLRCEQVEQRVVGRRDGTTEVRLLGTTGVELGELLCLFQEVAVETHDASTASAGSAIGRNERYGHRSGATRRAMGSRIARSRCAAFKKSLSFLETSSVRNAQIQRAGSPEWSSPVRKRRSASSGGRSDSIACSISFPNRSASGSS